MVAELEFGPQGDFVTMANSAGNGVVIVPVKSFKPQTTYITVLTTGLKDSSGKALMPLQLTRCYAKAHH